MFYYSLHYNDRRKTCINAFIQLYILKKGVTWIYRGAGRVIIRSFDIICLFQWQEKSFIGFHDPFFFSEPMHQNLFLYFPHLVSNFYNHLLTSTAPPIQRLFSSRCDHVSLFPRSSESLIANACIAMQEIFFRWWYNLINIHYVLFFVSKDEWIEPFFTKHLYFFKLQC